MTLALTIDLEDLEDQESFDQLKGFEVRTPDRGVFVSKKTVSRASFELVRIDLRFLTFRERERERSLAANRHLSNGLQIVDQSGMSQVTLLQIADRLPHTHTEEDLYLTDH